jgi:hypothetical protein
MTGDKSSLLGVTVRTVADAGSKDWDEGAKEQRNGRWGKNGHIDDYSDAHGLTYRVVFEDGRGAWYEPEELEVVYSCLVPNCTETYVAGCPGGRDRGVPADWSAQPDPCGGVLRRCSRHSEPEIVNHPAHYGGDTTYEAIKVIEAWQLGFCLGNAVKYICRAGKKPGVDAREDLKKALWYLRRAIGEDSA